MRVLDLFSGIGGFSLGLERAGMRTTAFVEIDPYCRAVLAKHWPNVPCYDDVRTVTADRLRADGIEVDVICGGFPCQPFSHAGKQLGATDDRHLWPEMRRIIGEVRPAFVVGENVIGIVGMELDAVLSDLEAIGYATRAFVIPAVAVDAPHRRDRVWIIACDTDRDGKSGFAEHAEVAQLSCLDAGSSIADSGRGHRIGTRQPIPARRLAVDAGDPAIAANADSERGRRGEARVEDAEDAWQPSSSPHRWPPFDAVSCGMDDGLPHRVHRLRALGNSVVPQVVEVIGRAIMEAA